MKLLSRSHSVRTRAKRAAWTIAALVIPILSIPCPVAAESSPPPAPGATAAPASPAPAAESADATPAASFFASTTVTAAGHEVDAFEITTPVTVIPQAEILRQAPRSASDLLRDEPGVDVNGVGPNQARPVIRGLRGLRVLFLEDGLRMNNARRDTDFGESPGIVDVGDLATVEVVRGAASVLYGSDAIGGVLNLVTQPPRFAGGERANGGADLRYDSAGAAGSAHATVAARSGGSGAVRFALSGSVRRSDDYDAPSGRFGDIDLVRSVKVRDTGLDDSSLFGQLAWDIDDHDLLTVHHRHYHAGQTGFGFVDPVAIHDTSGVTTRILYPNQDFDRTTVGWIGSTLGLLAADTIDAKLYYQSNRRKLVNQIGVDIGPIFPGAPDSSIAINTLNTTKIETWGTRVETLKGFGSRQLLSYGVEGYRDDSRNTDFGTTTVALRFPFPPFEQDQTTTSSTPNTPNAVQSSLGIFAQDEVSAGDRFKLTGGARYQRVTTNAESTPGLDTSGLDFSAHDIVGSLNALFQATRELNLVAGFGTAFRAPNIVERLFDGPTPEGDGFQVLNRGLVSERSRDLDLGIKWRRTDAYLEGTYFHNEIRDGIVQAFLSPEEIAALPAETQARIAASGLQAVVQERNVDRLRYEGVEIAGGYAMKFGLTVGGNLTHLSGRRIGTSAAPVAALYRDKWNLYLRYQPEHRRFWTEYRLRHNSQSDAPLVPNQPLPPSGANLPAFTVHTLAAGFVLFESGATRHELIVIVDNLTNRLYSEASNTTFFRPEPGRSVRATYRVRL